MKKSKSKKNYKFWFFVVSLAAFGFIVLTAIVSIWIVTIRGNISLGDVGVVVSALTGMISAFIVIPKIIAEHLFPADEDANMIAMVKSMQENDAKIRTYLKHKEDSDE